MKKTNRGTFWLVVLILSMTLVLIGCSQKPAPTTADKPSSEPPKASDNFPNKPVKILVHTSAGGPTDLMARELAKASESFLGGTIVVENKPGGSGATQMAAVKAAAPDGYTLATITPSQIGIWNGTLKGQYSVDSFSYVSGIQLDPYIIVVHTDSQFKTLKDLVEYMKINPNKLSVSGFGAVGSGHNVAWNIFADNAGVKANWTPYESTGDAVTALLGKHVDIANSNPGQVSQHVKAGKLRILGVMADKKLESYPDVPTYAEAGYTVDTSWAQFRGIYGPAGISEEVAQKLSSAFAKGVQTAEFKKYMKDSELEDGSMDHKKYTEFIKKQDKTTLDWLKKLGTQ